MAHEITDRDTDAQRWAFIFIVFVFVFEAYVIGVKHIDYFVYLLDSETPFFVLLTCLCIIGSIFNCFLFVKFAISSSWFYRSLYLAIFSISLIWEYGFQKALGRFSGIFDFETIAATTSDQKLESVFLYIDTRALIPAALLVGILIIRRKDTRYGLRHFLIVNALFILAFTISPQFVDQSFSTLAAAAFYRTNTEFITRGPITNGEWASSITGISIKRRAVKPPTLPPDYHPTNNVVVILDESMRGDHFSLNGYERETTPFLDRLSRDGVLHNWGIASSASTGSRFTYNAVITGLTPDDFPEVTEVKIGTFPTFFQFAKAMRYKTYFFDGQMNNFWGGTIEDLTFIDSWQGPQIISEGHGFDPWELDNMIARKVRAILTESPGNFIFIFKHGSHVAYNNDFPPGSETWTPSYSTSNKYDIPPKEDLPAVRNAYDNSIRYNVNAFFENLVSDYSRIPNNSVVLYSGDHGQTLFVNGKASHGGESVAEACVPLFIIGDLNGPVDIGYKASHRNIFPTVLDLIGYPREMRDWSSTPSLLTAKARDSSPRFFNPNLGRKVPFD